MPGLLSQQAAPPGGAPLAPPAAAPAPGQPDQTAAAGEEQPNVSPEEQQAYDQFVNNAFTLIYDDKAMPATLKGLKGNGNPVDGLANTAAMIVIRLADSAKEAGQEIPPDVLMHGGMAILEDLADLAKEADIHDFTEQELEGAVYKALDIYREKTGVDGGAGREQVMQDFDEVIKLNRSGGLDQIAPGLTEKVQAGAR